MARKSQAEAEAALHDQTNLLPRRQLILVFCIMSISLLMCFIDQNGIGVLLPSIARDLHAEGTISWAGTSALIANTVFQVLYGRLSDLFGRKNVLLSALVLLSLSDLACGLAVNPTMLYIFRGLAGVANGGITSLTMMIVSDVVTLQERGKYQGILGCMIGLGNAIGPLIAAGFEIHLTWRGLFYLLAPLSMVGVGASWKFLPTNMPKLNLRETIAKIDFLGLFTGTAAVILLLIPISDGGHTQPWDSPLIIAMLSVGGVCLIAFLIAEWKFASLPMMPLSLFRSVSVSVMMFQTFCLGSTYYSYIYFLPLYFQNVRGASPLMSAVLQMPLVLAQSPTSTMAGFYMTWYNKYLPTIYFGFGMWTLGAGLLIMADQNLNIGLVCFFLILMGAGTGCVFQPTLVALQAHSPKAQRAVLVSVRNFIRSSGAALGLAVSSAIMANVLKTALPPQFANLRSSSFATPDLSSYSAADQEIIRAGYAAASRAVFIWCVPLLGLSFLLTIFIRDHGLQRKEERDAAVLPQETIEQTRGDTADPEKGFVGSESEKAAAEGQAAASKEVAVPTVGSPDASRKPSLSSEKSGRSEH